MKPTRRRILAATATCLPLAGCAGEGDDPAEDDTPTETASPSPGATPSPTATPTPEATETTAAGQPMETPDETSTGTPTPSETATADGEADVRATSHSDLGEILVDAEGMALYMFDSDEQGAGESTCYDSCADAWPPLIAADPTPGDAVTAELTTFEREDGSEQVAADGWPLYYFASDGEPGDVTGQGVNGVWWVLRPDGTPVRSDGNG